MSEDKNDKTATINTIQNAVYVKRLAIPRYRNYNWYIPYDADNLYPNKVKTVAERSVTCSSAIKTHADFLSGQGFGEQLNEIIVNDEGQTIEEILKEKCTDEATYHGLALHFNYNRMGQIVEIQEIPFEGIRWTRDQIELVYAEDWSQIYNDTAKWVTHYKPFNPDNVINEINEVGIKNYNGQVLYVIPRPRDVYTVCRFDAAMNDAQFEDESTVYTLSDIQNGYAFGGLMKLPPALLEVGDDENESEFTKRTKTMKGAQGAGSWIAVPAMSEEAFKGKMLEPMTRPNADKLFDIQSRRAESNIYKSFQQPQILNGVAGDGMFNQDQFVDAFDYYNSKTQDERDYVEKFFNKFWPFTIWSKGEKLEIMPKEYITKRNKDATTNTDGSQESTEDK